MSKIKHDKTRTSVSLQQEYAQVSTALGQAYFAEREAIREQERLADKQDELAEAYRGAIERENAVRLATDQAAKNTKDFEDRGKEDSVQTDPTTPNGQDSQAST